jgi:TRAP-type mannitol/chloroaromatic compound transport system permease large subunit
VSDTIKGALPFMLVEVAFIVFASIFPQIIEVPLSILY